MFNSAIRQTNKWRLKGATYLKNNTFHFVGDYIDNKIQLAFDVNGAQKLVVIPEPLKSLASYTDEIKNGVVHYNTKAFEINHYTILSVDDSWTQSDSTIICYCQMPYDALSNTFILCDKLDTVSGMITKSNDCGVKVVNKVLAIRLTREQLNIMPEDSKQEWIKKFNDYLRNNPFKIIYGLAQPISLLLDNYTFDIQGANNIITCETQNAPTSFEVEYPVDVIINTTVDVKEIHELIEEVRELASDASGMIEVHDGDIKAHEDIRQTIAELTQSMSFDFGSFKKGV